MEIKVTALVTVVVLALMVTVLLCEVYQSFAWRYKMRKQRRKFEELLGKESKHVNLFVGEPAKHKAEHTASGKLDANLSARSGKREELKSEE